MAELFLVPTLSDAEARERALDIRESFLVEAPAGSGKTGLLIQRYLKLLADVEDPAQVLAITFTRKATSELRGRVLKQLVAARDRSAAADESAAANEFDRMTQTYAEAVLARDAAAGWRLLEQPGRLNIRTIDSVCQWIAGSLPVLSGSGGAVPTENAEPLYGQAARRTLMQLGGADARLNQAIETLLLHRDGNLADCEALLTTMLAWRDQWGRLVPVTPAELEEENLEATVLPRLNRALETIVCRALTRLQKTMPRHLLAALTGLAQRMAELPGYNGIESPIAICREFASAPGAAAEHLGHWQAMIPLILTPREQDWRGGFNKNHLGFEITRRDRAELKSLVARCAAVDGLREALCEVLNLPAAVYPAEQWQTVKALFRVLGQALVELQLVFAESGECDFTEIALLARGALRRDVDDGEQALTTAVGMGLQHLLVDEMQDTSTAQYELIALLTQHWDGASQTVFLVGDPKQSIYRFRQARVERFVATMRAGRLGDVPLTTLTLTANFRSQRRLVDSFNETFAEVFPAETDPWHPEQVPFVTATAARRESSAGSTSDSSAGLVWHGRKVLLGEAAARQTRAHAEEMARIANRWRRGGPASMAVLVRNRTHLIEVVAALRAAGVPYRAVEIEPLGERQEILDLLALTRALLHPADRVAWLAVLRAPWCGLTLADLHTLAGGDDEEDRLRRSAIPRLIVERGHELSEDGCSRLARVWPMFEAAEAQRGRLPVSEWVERTWHALGVPGYATDEELRNAAQYFGLLDKEEEGGARLDVATLTQRLGQLYAEPAVHPGAIDLLTIHKAKGLEWDVVFVPSLEKAGGRGDYRLLRWLELEDDLVAGILAPIAARGYDAEALYRWMTSVEAAREAAELKRLFYVACTRAKEELHLFAAPKAKANGEASVRRGTLLHAAWPAAAGEFRGAVVPMPAARPAAAGVVASLAAGAVPMIQRMTGGAVPEMVAPARVSAAARSFERPADANASFAARAFGNAVHGFLELLSQRAAAGQGREELLAEVPEWTPRVATILRAGGIGPGVVERLAGRVLAGLMATLRDPGGWWLLAPHPGAASEQTLVSATQTIRTDRTFLAGGEPLSEGETHVWIVDYKTSTHAQAGIEEFLERERARYAPQLEAYARELGGDGKPVRLALYYPMMAKLVWWGLD